MAPLLPLPTRTTAVVREKEEASVIVSLQGARIINEDRAHSPHPDVFCVHDGHGNQDVADMLVELLTRDVEWGSAAEGLTPESLMEFLGDIYTHLARALNDQPSGAVSMLALQHRALQGVCFAWVGDSQACVFDARDGRICSAFGVIDHDQADVALLMPSPEEGPGLFRMPCASQTRRLLETVPHTLLVHPPPILQIPDADHTARIGTDSLKESYCAMTTQNVAFLNAGAQKEFVLAQQQHAPQAIHVDISFVCLGKRNVFLDARVTDSTQPTRSIGDAYAPHRPMTYAQTMFAPLLASAAGGQPPQHQMLLMCSDGPFANGAFVNMDALAMCVHDPLAFVRTQFYRQGQEVTERLLFAGLLVSQPIQTVLARAGAHGTWRAFVGFLQTQHVPAVCSDKFIDTYLERTDEGERWREAARDALQWLTVHSIERACCAPSQNFGLHAQIAARLAVLMGSTDNVTLLLHRLALSPHPLQTPTPS